MIVAKEEKKARDKSKAAYRLVDISSIPDESRQAVLEDAANGGGEYGLEVVEIAINGPAQQPIYGVYAHSEEKWLAAQVDLGFEDPDTDEEKLAEDAAAKADAEAAAKKAAEDAELEAITKPATKK